MHNAYVTIKLHYRVTKARTDLEFFRRGLKGYPGGLKKGLFRSALGAAAQRLDRM